MLAVVAAWLILLIAAHTTFAQTSAPVSSHATALIIVGSPGAPMYARHYRDRAQRFHTALLSAGINADSITLLSGDPDWKSPIISGPATAESIAASIKKLATTLTPDDQFILILLGHGAANDSSCSFMVPGPDLQMKALHELLEPIRSRSQVILNFSASSGDAVKLLTRPGRINVASSSPSQVNDNDYAEFFLQAMDAPNLLETYNRSTLKFAQWIVRQKQPEAEGQVGWLVEGKESAALFKKLYGDPDTAADRQFVPSPDSDKPDADPPELVSRSSPFWIHRRLVTEYPALDDRGESTPASAITVKGFAAIEATAPAQEGFVAGHTKLGQSPPSAPTTR